MTLERMLRHGNNSKDEDQMTLLPTRVASHPLNFFSCTKYNYHANRAFEHRHTSLDAESLVGERGGRITIDSTLAVCSTPEVEAKRDSLSHETSSMKQ